MKTREINQYRVSNNTGFSRLYMTAHDVDALIKAEMDWKDIEPKADAGNLYAASFVGFCSTCGGEQDMTSDAITCDCNEDAE